MSTQWETVGIPFGDGIKPSTRARLLEATKLQVAQNCQYAFDQGPEKRHGHGTKKVFGFGTLIGDPALTPPTPRANYQATDTGIPSNWLYGYGIDDGTGDSSITALSPSPAAGLLFGQATRDDEIVQWDGFRFFIDTANERSTSINAVMPVLRGSAVSKAHDAQVQADMAENAVVRTVVWVSDKGVGYRSTYDTISGACIVDSEAISDTTNIRVLCVGEWTHILAASANSDSAKMLSFHQDTPTTVASKVVAAPTNNGQFDFKKSSESLFFYASTNANITVTLFSADGTQVAIWVSPTATSAKKIAIWPNQNRQLGVLWVDTIGAHNFVRFQAFDFAGNTLGSAITLAQISDHLLATPANITLSAGWHKDTSNRYRWMAYWDDDLGSSPYYPCIRAQTVTADGTLGTLNTRWNLWLGSHAFRAGNQPFVWADSLSSLQPTHLLLDAQLRPIGKMDFAQAYRGQTVTFLPGVNWYGSAPEKDILVFQGAQLYRQRVPSSTSSVSTVPSGTWAEPSVRVFELDFLPKLRFAQAGRSTLFAGAQVWQYDGASLGEATFALAPEKIRNVDFVQGTGGSLTVGKAYRYRIDLCTRNTQNEEIRSFSFVSDSTAALIGDKVTFNIPTVPTYRDSYFLVFRTEGDGANYYLVSSRDPSSSAYVANDQTQSSMAFTDRLADTVLITHEYHPANASNSGIYLDPLPAPACEIIAAGHDRVWLAGGELNPGEIAPSRLFATREAPTFSPALNVEVDRGSEHITNIGFVGDLGFFFRENQTYVLDSDGPDNTGNGAWQRPRLALADIGAIEGSPMGIGPDGLFFQTFAGLRLMGANGQLSPNFGYEVDSLTASASLSSVVVVPAQYQVRFYSSLQTDNSFVYNYKLGLWTTWTNVGCVGASHSLVTQAAVLAKPDAQVWHENPLTFLDGDRTYEMVIRTAPLHAENAGAFWRIRRWALFGTGGGHDLRIRYFYDDSPDWEEETVLTIPDGNGTAWGEVGSTWGVGQWGDMVETYQRDQPGDGLAAIWYRDGKFRIRKRPHRQKCSVWAVEFSDLGAPNAGFTPYILAIELGKKTGLDRVPPAGQ